MSTDGRVIDAAHRQLDELCGPGLWEYQATCYPAGAQTDHNFGGRIHARFSVDWHILDEARFLQLADIVLADRVARSGRTWGETLDAAIANAVAEIAIHAQLDSIEQPPAA